MESIFDILVEAWSGWLQWLFVAVAIDLLFGVVVSLKAGDFKWEKIANYMQTNLPKVFGWLLLFLLSKTPADKLPPEADFISSAAVYTSYITIYAAIAGSILGHMISLGIFPAALRSALMRLGIAGKYIPPKPEG